MSQVFLTTTGTVAKLVIDGYEYEHPITNRALLFPDGYLKKKQLEGSEQMQSAVDAGSVTLTDDLGNAVTDLNDIPTTNLGNLIVKTPSSADDLEIGWLDNLTPGGVNSYGIKRRTGASGYFTWFPNSNFPQIMAGNPNATSDVGFFIDADSGGDLYLNVLTTGIVGQRRVFIGKGIEGNVILNGYPEGILTTNPTGGIVTASSKDIRDRVFNQTLDQDSLSFSNGSNTPTSYQAIPNSDLVAGKDADYLVTANFSARTIGSNNRTLQFALFVNTIETLSFEPLRFDQQNDDKSITIRYVLLGLSQGDIVDWEVRNVSNSIDLRFDRRCFTMEEF